MESSNHTGAVEEEGTVLEDGPAIKRPKLYKVFLHNDDITTMEFVIFILETVFKKNPQQAQELMLKVHHEGMAVCGVYSYEIAESKATRVTQLAKEKGHPLKCTMGPE